MVAEPNTKDETKRIDALVGELHRTFPQVPPELVRHAVVDAWQEFLGAPVREFVPLLVRRRATSCLRIV